MVLLGSIYWGDQFPAYPEILQLFNNEINLVSISVQKSLIKVATDEIYGMKWVVHNPKLHNP